VPACFNRKVRPKALQKNLQQHQCENSGNKANRDSGRKAQYCHEEKIQGTWPRQNLYSLRGVKGWACGTNYELCKKQTKNFCVPGKRQWDPLGSFCDLVCQKNSSVQSPASRSDWEIIFRLVFFGFWFPGRWECLGRSDVGRILIS
jgi:hypothetical protein